MVVQGVSTANGDATEHVSEQISRSNVKCGLFCILKPHLTGQGECCH
jgi:hypothetical protein